MRHRAECCLLGYVSGNRAAVIPHLEHTCFVNGSQSALCSSPPPRRHSRLMTTRRRRAKCVRRMRTSKMLERCPSYGERNSDNKIRTCVGARRGRDRDGATRLNLGQSDLPNSTKGCMSFQLFSGMWRQLHESQVHQFIGDGRDFSAIDNDQIAIRSLNLEANLIADLEGLPIDRDL